MVEHTTNRDGNRRIESSRLVYYHKTPSKEYWEKLWEGQMLPGFYEPFRAGKLFNFKRIFIRHLPKRGMILEAGCGSAHLVLALNVNGYDCLGLDFAVQTLRYAQHAVGPLPLISGDLTAIGISDEVFDAIISIGVVEHRRAGPEPFLVEMHRVLKPLGTLLISVPYFNPLRQLRARRGAYQDDVRGLDFYQYAFTRDEFCRLLMDAGFEIETTYTYSHQHALTQELRWLKKIPESLKNLILRISKYVPYINSQAGHMVMVVARKTNGSK